MPVQWICKKCGTVILEINNECDFYTFWYNIWKCPGCGRFIIPELIDIKELVRNIRIYPARRTKGPKIYRT